MKKKMIFISIFLALGFLVSLPVFIITKSGIAESVVITLGISLYHFAMRLAVGYTVNFIMKNKANHNNAWFKEKSFEKKLYKLLGVKRWKKHLPTYSPETFDTTQKSVAEIIGATCQAEVVHEIIMVLSLLPITLIPFLGGAVAFIITSFLAMAFDGLFAMLQRYNRPRLVKVMARLEKNNE